METKLSYLVLENGTVFCGEAFGCEADTIGELVFSTHMVGCLETLTDPNFCGQIVVETFPLIGNYGLISQECESKGASLAAYIVRDLCQEPSNFRCEGTLDVFLKNNGVVGLSGIDTRRLTRIIRNAGSIMAKITHSEPDVEAIKSELAAYSPKNAVSAVTCSEKNIAAPEKIIRRTALLDLGAKDSIRDSLLERGCEVITYPAFTKAEDILADNPDGIVISNGPGNPSDYPEIIAEIAKLAEAGKPILAIDLGNLMLAKAMGAETLKMSHAHRGSQPAIRLADGRVFITNQNYSYTVKEDTIPGSVKVTYRNGNDSSPEGMEYNSIPAIGIQFVPTAAGGPSATHFIYDSFVEMMK